MLRLLRGFLLYWLILWLPLQSAVVLAMPLCGMTEPVPVAAPAGEHPCHQSATAHGIDSSGVARLMAAPDFHASAQDAGDKDPACEHCSPCRMIHAGFMPGVPPVTGSVVSHHVQHAAPVLHMARVYLPLEHRPPILA